MRRPGFVRIIGGEFRGRKLEVPPKSVRPTPDRVRETVFNWLTLHLPNAYCLDAFAGSGAFGFEALSRGAAHVVMVDQSKQVIDLLKKEALTLGLSVKIEFHCVTVPKGLSSPAKPFDIVFLDPPYQSDCLLTTCFYLEEKAWLANPAYIYIETAKPIEANTLPDNWSLIKNKKTGQVAYHLVQRLL